MLSLISTLGLRPFILCSHLLIMNKIKPMLKNKVVWTLKHYTTWAHHKMEWTPSYLGARRR